MKVIKLCMKINTDGVTGLARSHLIHVALDEENLVKDFEEVMRDILIWNLPIILDENYSQPSKLTNLFEVKSQAWRFQQKFRVVLFPRFVDCRRPAWQLKEPRNPKLKSNFRPWFHFRRLNKYSCFWRALFKLVQWEDDILKSIHTTLGRHTYYVLFQDLLKKLYFFILEKFVQSKTEFLRKPKVKDETNFRLQTFARNWGINLVKFDYSLKSNMFRPETSNFLQLLSIWVHI